MGPQDAGRSDLGGEGAVADGTVDPKRVGIFGVFYGGYATLAGVAFTPNVYAVAVAYAAPSNLITLLDAIPPYWEAMRKQMYTRMGDPTTPDGKALLIAESPLAQAKAIVTPLMVVQGKNDPRVNVRESNQIVSAVRDNGKPVEYLVAPDEGQGFARPINNLAMVTAMEKFIAEYLGGRFQEDVSSDVEAKLKGRSEDCQWGYNPEWNLSGTNEINDIRPARHIELRARWKASAMRLLVGASVIGAAHYSTNSVVNSIVAPAFGSKLKALRVVFHLCPLTTTSSPILGTSPS